MHPDNALLTIAAATATGLLAQLLGHRLRLPAIVPLLAFGVLLGPSMLGVVHPEALGRGLPVIVKLAVAVILFDGALNLRLADLRRAMREVRNLVTIGVLVTWVGATLAAHYVARLSWPVAIVFGALVTVTGPTVVQPLLKRVALPRSVRTTASPGSWPRSRWDSRFNGEQCLRSSGSAASRSSLRCSASASSSSFSPRRCHST